MRSDRAPFYDRTMDTFVSGGLELLRFFLALAGWGLAAGAAAVALVALGALIHVLSPGPKPSSGKLPIYRHIAQREARDVAQRAAAERDQTA